LTEAHDVPVSNDRQHLAVPEERPPAAARLLAREARGTRGAEVVAREERLSAPSADRREGVARSCRAAGRALEVREERRRGRRVRRVHRRSRGRAGSSAPSDAATSGTEK